MKKLTYFLFVLPFLGFAQQESYYSLYQFNMQVINPAYAGAEVPTMFSVLNRNQWATIDNAPKTTALAYSSYLKNNVSLGLSVVSDKVFVEQQTYAYVDFSYKLTMDDKTDLFLGIKAGGNFYFADGTKLNSNGIGVDPAQSVLNKFNPNVGAGVLLKGQKYWISLSVPRLFEINREKDLAIGAKDRIHTYLGGGFDIRLNDIFTLQPSLMLRKVKGLPSSIDFTGFINVKDRIRFGTSYRTKASLSLMTFINVFNGFDIGYAFETPSEQKLLGTSIKTHELILRIRLGQETEATNEQSESIEGPMNQ